MGNSCTGKSIEKEETVTEHVQFLNQITLWETRYAHLNHKGQIICYRCRRHGVLAINIEFEGFASQHVHLWPSQKVKSILCKRKNGIRFADRF